jgi:hypothetical protein
MLSVCVRLIARSMFSRVGVDALIEGAQKLRSLTLHAWCVLHCVVYSVTR